MQAVIKDANAPPIIALKTSSEISFFRSGAIPPIPPNCIPIEPKLANPHKA